MTLSITKTFISENSLHLISPSEPKPDPRIYLSHHEELSSSFRQEVPKTKEGEAEKLYNGVLGHNNSYFILDAELRKTEWESLQLLRLSDAIKKINSIRRGIRRRHKNTIKRKARKTELKN